MGFGWIGEKIRLVPLDRAKHAENACRWLNDPEVTQWTLVGDMPLSRLAEDEYLERLEKGVADQIGFAITTLSGEHIGFSGLHDIDYRHGTAMSGSFIGQKEMWGQGLGTDAAMVRTWYAFEILGLRLLTASVLEGNQASIAMLAKAGYRETGRIPQRYFKRGVFRDEILMVRLKQPSEGSLQGSSANLV